MCNCFHHSAPAPADAGLVAASPPPAPPSIEPRQQRHPTPELVIPGEPPSHTRLNICGSVMCVVTASSVTNTGTVAQVSHLRPPAH